MFFPAMFFLLGSIGSMSCFRFQWYVTDVEICYATTAWITCKKARSNPDDWWFRTKWLVGLFIWLFVPGYVDGKIFGSMESFRTGGHLLAICGGTEGYSVQRLATRHCDSWNSNGWSADMITRLDFKRYPHKCWSVLMIWRRHNFEKQNLKPVWGSGLLQHMWVRAYHREIRAHKHRGSEELQQILLWRIIHAIFTQTFGFISRPEFCFSSIWLCWEFFPCLSDIAMLLQLIIFVFVVVLLLMLLLSYKMYREPLQSTIPSGNQTGLAGISSFSSMIFLLSTSI